MQVRKCIKQQGLDEDDRPALGFVSGMLGHMGRKREQDIIFFQIRVANSV